MTAKAAFGTSAMLFPAALFLVSFGIIMTERVNRAVIAILAAGLAVAFGFLAQSEAVAAIDFNTVALLVGTMIIVGITKKSGVFGYLAIRAAQIMRASPAGILFALALVAAAISAFLPNATTVLFIAPLTLVIATELGLPAYPFLFAEIFASNIGGDGNADRRSAQYPDWFGGGTFLRRFLVALGPVVLIVLAVQSVLVHLIWGQNLRAAS